MPLDKRIDNAREAAQRLEKELRPGERLLWSGKPRKGLRFDSSDLVRTAFMAFWVAGVGYWNVRAASPEAPLFFRFGGAVFLAIGLYALAGRFFVDAWERRRTFYGVTSDRVIIVTEFFSHRTRSRQLDALPDLSVDERSDRNGAIDFGQMEPDSRGAGLAFRQLGDCAAVCDIVVQARSRARERRA